MTTTNGNGQKGDYRAIIKWLAGILVVGMVGMFGWFASATDNLEKRADKIMECKVDKHQYDKDMEEVKENMKEAKQDLKDFRRETKGDLKEIIRLIRDVR